MACILTPWVLGANINCTFARTVGIFMSERRKCSTLFWTKPSTNTAENPNSKLFRKNKHLGGMSSSILCMNTMSVYEHMLLRIFIVGMVSRNAMDYHTMQWTCRSLHIVVASVSHLLERDYLHLQRIGLFHWRECPPLITKKQQPCFGV